MQKHDEPMRPADSTDRATTAPTPDKDQGFAQADASVDHADLALQA
jgi:hypothetical protein